MREGELIEAAYMCVARALERILLQWENSCRIDRTQATVYGFPTDHGYFFALKRRFHTVSLVCDFMLRLNSSWKLESCRKYHFVSNSLTKKVKNAVI